MAKANYTSKIELPKRIFVKLEKEAKRLKINVDLLANNILRNYTNIPK